MRVFLSVWAGLVMYANPVIRCLLNAAIRWGGKESGSWAFMKAMAFGQTDPSLDAACPFWFWRWCRWAALGISGPVEAAEADTQDGGWEGDAGAGGQLPVALGVRVRMERECCAGVAGDGHPGPPWTDVVRNCADVVLEYWWGPAGWQWMKRGLFNVDEEEGTGLWRLTKHLALGIPTGDVGVFSIVQEDQYPIIMGRSAFWDALQSGMLGIQPSS